MRHGGKPQRVRMVKSHQHDVIGHAASGEFDFSKQSNENVQHATARSDEKPQLWALILFGLIAAFLTAIAAFGISFGAQALQVKNHEQKAVQILTSIMSDSTSADQIPELVKQAQAETKAANTITHRPTWNKLATMPKIGTDIQTVQGLTDVVNTMMDRTVPQFADILANLNGIKLFENETVNVAPVVAMQDQIKTASESFQEDVKLYNAIPEPNITQLKTMYDSAGEKLNSASEMMGSLSDAIKILPVLFESEEPQTYAIIAVTPSETRSGGGLVGSIGELTIEDGKLSIGDFRSNAEYYQNYGGATVTDDEERVFREESPLHMSFDIRDIAFSPDTQRTAEMMQSIWEQTSWGADNPLSGIIMVDPVFVQGIVKATGNVTLSDGRVLTGDNTAEFLMNKVYTDYPVSKTDEIFSTVATTAIEHMFKDLSTSTLLKLGEMMPEMAQQRHFSMYSFNDEVEPVLKEIGFTASTPDDATKPEVGIYVDENSPSKMGWYLHRDTTIMQTSCGSSTSGATYHVEYTLHNTMTEAETKSLPDYITGVANQQYGWAMERIFFFPPKDGSITNLKVIKGNADDPVPDTLNGVAMYSGLATVKAGETVTYSFDVTVSDKATTTLGIDQTPMGWTNPKIDVTAMECPVVSGTSKED